jgi:hypothetical protein
MKNTQILENNKIKVVVQDKRPSFSKRAEMIILNLCSEDQHSPNYFVYKKFLQQ